MHQFIINVKSRKVAQWTQQLDVSIIAGVVLSIIILDDIRVRISNSVNTRCCRKQTTIYENQQGFATSSCHGVLIGLQHACRRLKVGWEYRKVLTLL